MGHKSREVEAMQTAQVSPPSSTAHKKKTSHKRKREGIALAEATQAAASTPNGIPYPSNKTKISRAERKEKKQHRNSKESLADRKLDVKSGATPLHDPQSTPSDRPEVTSKGERKKKRKHGDDDEKSAARKAKKQKSASLSKGLPAPVEAPYDPTPTANDAPPTVKKYKKPKTSLPPAESFIPLEVPDESGVVEALFEKNEKNKKEKRKHTDDVNHKVPSKKAKKAKRLKPEDALPTPPHEPADPVETRQNDEDEDEAAQSGNKKSRFIVFVGNLPFTTTDASLKDHFAKIHPDHVRHITHKPEEGEGTSTKNSAKAKSKGFAFLEFASYDRMRTCLKLYHHSSFEGRKINVELTAGGGKNSEGRKEKLKWKNERLNEQRKRRSEEEARTKAENKKGEEEEKKGNDHDDGQGEIHPSRRAQIPEG